ncbi:MAG: polysaccharide biosynthesis protein, partial [Lachnospiraceae bacterium]|nr:polysaccharide biosynthesis protein [Lachnospiraceae bacterium]
MSGSPEKKSRYRYLADNIALFSISNFVSKILVFLLVPLYTDVLTTYEYGIADVMQVTLLLLVPALTLNMGEAALRFGIEYAGRRGGILKTGLRYVLRGDALVVGLCIIMFAFSG